MIRLFNILLSLLRFWPHIVVYLRSKSKDIISYDIEKWIETHTLPSKPGIRGLLNLLAGYPEFRSLFYFRTDSKWLSFLGKGQTNLEFYTNPKNVGRGLVIWHGFSTVINARSIGDDCQIWQNVTIGKSTTSSEDNRPIIGNSVLVAANAVVVGRITIGDNVTIGAGAVTVKDVQSDTVVVGQPSRFIKH